MSGLLAAVLFLSPVLSVRAAELSEETVQETTVSETAAPAEVTEPVQTIDVTEPPETTVSTEPTQAPTVPVTTESTEPSETTAETENTAEAYSTRETVLTIAQAWAMDAGTDNITVQGTVVFATGSQAVLQDSTGGIRLSFGADPGTVPGEILKVTGKRSGGLYVYDFESLGMGSLPSVETTLLEAPDNLRVRIRKASLGRDSLTQNGFSMTMKTTEQVTAGRTADVYGVILDGNFYADTIVPVTVFETETEQNTQEEQNWNLYFGQLHAHTTLSDGADTVTEAFEYAASVDGLDFFAVTDHSDSFDNAAFGSIGINGSGISTEWAEGKDAAEAVTDETFVGLFGYEMSWPEDLALGHINTFNTPGWQAWGQAGFKTLESYYEALTTVPDSISQFNHPGDIYGNFKRFSNYTAEYDAVMHLLEVGSGENAYTYYNKALDAGWHLAPSNPNPALHKSLQEALNPGRTVVLAQELTEESILEAIRSHRVYTTQDSDLRVSYTLNGKIMGSIIGSTDTMEVWVSLEDPTDSIDKVEVIVDGGTPVVSQKVAASAAELTIEVPGGYHYYYLQITQRDDDTAVTAPVWVDNYEALGIHSFTSSEEQPMQEQEVTLTLELYNQENEAFQVESLTFYHNDTVIHEIQNPGTVRTLSTLSYHFPFTWAEPGEVEIRAVVTGTIADQNRTYEQPLKVYYQAKQTAVCTIGQARKGTVGAAYRVKGYITAGNQNPYNTFEDMLYLQDDTGGIAVTGCTVQDIQVGAPMEATGVLRSQGGNLVLELTDFDLLEETYYRYVPRTMTNEVAMNYQTHGGELLQIEGEVVSLTKTADGKGISRLTLKDVRGDTATVVIEDNIRSSSYGTNELAAKIKKGRTVRAMGLLHVDEYGETVLRVRNCDEVVYVAPTLDPSNPKTGDWFCFWK